MTEPQYQLGDVVNAHRLTEQPDGSLAWLPLTADSPPKKSRRGLWITLIVIGAAFLVIVVASILNRPSDDALPDAGTLPASEGAESAADPEPELVTVPEGLVGKSARDASNALAAVGLFAAYDGDPNAKVTAVAPVATQVKAGTTMTLTLERPPVLTMGQQQAVGKAKQYLRYMAFSRSGLIQQLEYEGFSTGDATFAVDNVRADWNAQAAAKAKSYLEMMAFSRQGLIEQLVYEGFTPTQAEYGAAANGY